MYRWPILICRIRRLLRISDQETKDQKFKVQLDLFIGDCTDSKVVPNVYSLDLIITSPPYFNAPYDYRDFFSSYNNFLSMIYKFSKIYFQTLKHGGIITLNIDDMLIKGMKYPIISDTTKILTNLGFIFLGIIVWKKPEGYIRISRRSGVFIQHPYPMYFYPDNLIENILIFQKPLTTDFEGPKSVIITDIWEITNVLPLKNRLEFNIAAFPEEIPEKLIKLFTNRGGWVCDPFLGSGTTMKAAFQLKRNCLGVEIEESLIEIIQKKIFKSTQDERHLQIYSRSKRQEDSYPETDYLKLSSIFSSQNLVIPQFSGKKVDLVILDLRNEQWSIQKEYVQEIINSIKSGRILIVYYDVINGRKKGTNIYDIFDLVLVNGLRFRDKITIRHLPEFSWQVKTNFNTKVRFKHSFYEAFIFQNGKFNYSTKTKEEKNENKIDLTRFQSEKWFLSFWDFGTSTRAECDPQVNSRFIQLFLYNGEILATNFEGIKCKERKFTTQYLKIKV